MKPGRKPGTPKTGGRQKGTVNKATEDVTAKLQRLGCDPIEGMMILASGKAPCGVCHGLGRTKYRAPTGDLLERVCESCYGSKMERISPDLRGKMYAELAQYVYPKRKALELSGNVLNLADRLKAGRERALRGGE